MGKLRGFELQVEGVPRGLVDNARWRLGLLQEAMVNQKLQDGLMELCRKDLCFWIDAFVWQYNPNVDEGSEYVSKVGPFVLWDFQKEALRVMMECVAGGKRRDLVIEKSREMGASWLCLLLMDWFLLFGDREKFLCISRNEQAVDRAGDSDSLFWKLDFVHLHLPRWMLRCPPHRMRRRLGFEHPVTKTVITGQASTGKAGVGGRATAMFIDEFSQIKEDFEVLHRTSDTTACRIFNGTHRGPATAFAELTRRVDCRKLQMHWSCHPEKRKGLYRYNEKTSSIEVLDPSFRYEEGFKFVERFEPVGGVCPGLRSPWYDEQCRRKASRQAVAMDLDIDMGGSVSQFFSPMIIRRLEEEHAIDPIWEGDVVADVMKGELVSLQRREGGMLRLWVMPSTSGSFPPSLYAVGVDVSTGVGMTNSVASILDVGRGEKVGELASATMKPEEFAAIVVALCRVFRSRSGDGAYLCWEAGGPGGIFGMRVLDYGWGRIWYRDPSRMTQPGFFTTSSTKRLLLEEYRAALEGGAIVNRSLLALRECYSYRYNERGCVEHPMESSKHDPTGARVNHGDRVIADALAWLCRKLHGLTGFTSGDRLAQVHEPAQPGGILYRRRLRHQEERPEAILLGRNDDDGG